MRLTLRTMLAFLDDVLEGPDAKELEQKIDESKFASDLVHRIRGSVRRLRLGAPKLDGKGMGADANTVAAYLDNTMPPERVPDFEKVCLESDVQLAEVAACHQVLTIVLGEPAAVDPGIRDRMYRIGQPETAPVHPPVSHDGNGIGQQAVSAEPPMAAKSAATEPIPARTQPVRTRAKKPAKTEGEPTESMFPLKSLAITLLLFFVVTAVALRAIAPIDSNHPLWVMFAGQPNGAQVAQPAIPTTSASSDSTPQETATKTRDTSTATQSVEATATVKETNTSDASTTTEPADAPDVSKAAPVTESPVKSSPAVPPATTSAEPTLPVPPPVDPESAPAATASAPATAPQPVVEPAPAVRPTAPVHVGRYISEGQVLARLDAEKNAWMVLPPDTPLNAGERLLSLPTYRPQLFVAPTVKVTLAGETFVKLHVPDASNSSRISVDFGRVLLVPVGEMGNSVHVDFGGRKGQLNFADVESVVAAEVIPYLPVGANPLTATPHLVVQIWATSGGAEWHELERPSVRLNAGQRLQFVDDSPVAVVDGAVLPDWIDGKNLKDIDRRASQELRKFLTTDRPLALSLLEQTNYRQVEVRALSCRCLCYLDIFEPAITALGDDRYQSYWDAQIAAIQSTLPFGQDSVANCRAAIEKVYGKDADRIFRLLQGYSPEQLAAGGAAELVDGLENELMAIRVLAFITLVRITKITLQFNPDERPEQEKSKVIRWRKLLEDGLIVYKNPPVSGPPPVPPPATATPK